MKKFIATILLVIPVFVLVSVVNFSIDPASVFGEGVYELESAKLLQESDIEHTKDNYNERLMKKYYIKIMNGVRSMMVLGSSRSMEIDSTLVQNQSFFNASVSGAVLQDIIGLTEVLYEHEKLPDKLIIGIDPWMFNTNNGDERWKNGLLSDYNRFADRGNSQNRLQSPEIDERAKVILSPTYYQESVKKLLHSFKAGNSDMPIVATNNISSEHAIMQKDGSIIYPVSMQEVEESAVDRSVMDLVASNYFYQLDNFTQMDDGLKKEFEAYLYFLDESGIDYEFFLAPYHPIVYEHFENTDKYKTVLEVEEYIRTVSKKHNIIVRGSYDPTRVGVSNKDFFDAMHARKEAIEKVFNYIERE